jgi:hypothetical protein
MSGLHALVDNRLQVAAHGIKVNLVAQPLG